MAPESCNLGKDEAEILKASSASPSSSSSSPQNPPSQAQPAAQPSPSCLLLKPSLDFLAHKSEMTEISAKASSLPKPGEKSRLPVLFSHRCSTCRKRLGLTGFRCRCGDLFCALHRYSDRHGCTFDYKAAGRAEISKANPLIRAAKIIKI